MIALQQLHKRISRKENCQQDNDKKKHYHPNGYKRYPVLFQDIPTAVVIFILDEFEIVFSLFFRHW